MRAEPVIEGYAAQLRQSRGQERSAFQIGEIDRQRGAGASIAVRRAETEHDHGGREWEGHEVSQENGCGLQERGTTAIRRMVPPQSGQMAKSAPAFATLCAESAINRATATQSFARIGGMCWAIGIEFIVISG